MKPLIIDLNSIDDHFKQDLRASKQQGDTDRIYWLNDQPVNNRLYFSNLSNNYDNNRFDLNTYSIQYSSEIKGLVDDIKIPANGTNRSQEWKQRNQFFKIAGIEKADYLWKNCIIPFEVTLFLGKGKKSTLNIELGEPPEVLKPLDFNDGFRAGFDEKGKLKHVSIDGRGYDFSPNGRFIALRNFGASEEGKFIEEASFNNKNLVSDIKLTLPQQKKQNSSKYFVENFEEVLNAEIDGYKKEAFALRKNLTVNFEL